MNTHSLLNRLRDRSRFVEGKRVVLDKDAAAMYGVSVGRLRQAVRRHKMRFPPDLLLEINNGAYAFTETGIVMLSTILKSRQAVQTNVEIIRELFSFRAN